jgi:hypothetical protein
MLHFRRDISYSARIIPTLKRGDGFTKRKPATLEIKNPWGYIYPGAMEETVKSKFLQSLLFLHAKIMQYQLVVMQIDLDHNKIRWLHKLKSLIGNTGYIPKHLKL